MCLAGKLILCTFFHCISLRVQQMHVCCRMDIESNTADDLGLIGDT
jgi:hypothetical protein